MTYWQRGARTAGWWAAAVLGLLVVGVSRGPIPRGRAGRTGASISPDDGRRDVRRAVGLGMATRDRAWGRSCSGGPRSVLAGELPSAFPESRSRRRWRRALRRSAPIVFAQMALSYPDRDACSRDDSHGSTSSSSVTRPGDPERRQHALPGICANARSARPARADADPRRAAAVLARGLESSWWIGSSWRSSRSGSSSSIARTRERAGRHDGRSAPSSSPPLSSRARLGSPATPC